MRVNEIKAKFKGRFRSKCQTQISYVAPNILEQNFTCSKPNEKWASDISYIRTSVGWLYLAVIIDLFSRKVIGMAISKIMNANLVVKALYEAVGKRNVNLGIILHSDQGVQYRSELFQNNLVLYGIIASMSSRGNCYDNSMVESFFGTLKTELEWEGRFSSIEQAKSSIFEYMGILQH
jgi:putative transposase